MCEACPFWMLSPSGPIHFDIRVFLMRNFKSAGTRNPCYLFHPPISRLTVALATKFLKTKILLFLLLMNTTLTKPRCYYD